MQQKLTRRNQIEKKNMSSVLENCFGKYRDYGIVYYVYILPSMSGIAAVSMTIPIFIYTKSFLNGTLKTPKSLFYLGLVLFITLFSLFIVEMVRFPSRCLNLDQYLKLRIIASQLALLSSCNLFATYFYRLYLIFKGTAFALNTITIIVICAIFIVGILIYIPSIIGWTLGISELEFLSAGLQLLAILLFVYMVYLFIYKLVKIMRSTKDDSEVILKLMTKTTLLAMISCITFTLAISTSIMVGDVFMSIHFSFFCHFCIVCNYYTSFLCIFLSYQRFDGWYSKLCGCFESVCFKMWGRCIGVNGDSIMLEKVVVESTMNSVANEPTVNDIVDLPSASSDNAKHDDLQQETEMSTN